MDTFFRVFESVIELGHFEEGQGPVAVQGMVTWVHFDGPCVVDHSLDVLLCFDSLIAKLVAVLLFEKHARKLACR